MVWILVYEDYGRIVLLDMKGDPKIKWKIRGVGDFLNLWTT